MLLAFPFRSSGSTPGVSPSGGTGEPLSQSLAAPSSTPSSSLCNSTVVPNGTQVLGSLCIGSSPQYVVYDSSNGDVYASSENSQNVSVVSPSSGLPKVQTISASHARGLALDPADGRMFVTNGLGSNVTVLDTTNNNAVVGTFDLTGYTDLVGAQYNPLTGLVFFLANNNADLVGVNPSTFAISLVIPVDPNPGGASGYAIDPVTHQIYFPSLGSDSVQIINESSGTTLTWISMEMAGSPYGPTSTFYDPANHLIYVMLGGTLASPGNLLYVVDPISGNTVVRMTVGSFPNAYAFDPVRNLLYVACAASGTISIVNVTSSELVGTIYLGTGTLPTGIAVDPATGNVFVGEDGTGLLVELPSAAPTVSTSVCQPAPTPFSVRVLASTCIGNWPSDVVYDPANGLIYASSENSQNVSVVNVNGLQKVGTLWTGNYARGLAIDPVTGTLFVTDGFGDDVAAVNTSTNDLVGSFNLTLNGTPLTYLVGAQYDPYTGLAFFLANNNDDLVFVNATTYAIVQVVYIYPNPGGGSGPIAAINPASHVIYFPSRNPGGYWVQEINELTGATLGYLTTSGSYAPTETFYDDANGLLYVPLGGWMWLGAGNTLEVFNASTGSPVTTLNVGSFPGSMAFDASRNLLYVSCADSGSISVINTTTNQVVANVSLGTGSEPGAMAIDPSTGNLFVGEDGTGLLLELPPGLPSNTIGYWTPEATPSAPPARAGFGMVYDDAMGKVVLFGGCVSGSFVDQDCNATNDLWTYSGGSWTQLHPAVSPSPRLFPMMVYDPATLEIVLFGGFSGAPNNTPLHDTWEFDGTTWTEWATASSPPASGMGEAMVYDAASGTIVLFASSWSTSAQGSPVASTNETWTFSSGQWTQVLNGTGPSPRGDESSDYDSSAGAMVLFGGSGCGYVAGLSACPSLGDTWTYANQNWSLSASAGGPSGRTLAAMAYDPQMHASLLFGGESAAASDDDLWEYAPSSWTPVLTPIPPPPREGAGMVYDAADQTMVMYGGYLHIGPSAGGGEIYYNDTWTFGVTPPSQLSVVAMQLSEGPAAVNSLALIVGDVQSANFVGYSFSGLPPGCLALDTSVLVCRPTANGTYEVDLTVTDSFGASAAGSILLVVGNGQFLHAPSVAGVNLVTWVVSGVAGAAIGVAVVASAAYARERQRRRDRREGDAIVRELEGPGGPDRPMP